MALLSAHGRATRGSAGFCFSLVELLGAACLGLLVWGVVLQLTTPEGPISYTVGSAPSAIWRGRVLMRCGPAFGLHGEPSGGPAQNRVLLDGLADPGRHTADRDGAAGGCGGVRVEIKLPQHAIRMHSEYAVLIQEPAMPSLQIRDLPDPLHRLLQRRASAQKRSLSQQALADLEAIAGGDPRQRRQQALERIAQRWQQRPALQWNASPESLIRSDRER
ncbi:MULTISPECIES: FitA-like ribbon-helix-helix domain-containing protein [unclassified Cyanobium]|jgi:plasmid stability protein|uniref:FitA-like ribbon-helix-helix domain-containing protein n=1 Tax=unclassified Cyanobium TaxID=2627006 RepID=UPI0020CBA410|nr:MULTISPECIES: hypothetical protein [unclassified Cyanobium]